MAVSAQRGDTTPAVQAAQPLDVQIISPPVPPSEMSDEDLGREAALAVDRAVMLRENSAEQARRAGELLLEAKHRCRANGTSFRYWLQKHWTKSKATADAYILIATEVQSDLAGAPDQKTKDLLSCQSIRAFLTDRGYGAGGTRAAKDDDEKAEEEQATIDRLAQEREDERQGSKADRRPREDSAPAAARGGLASPLSREEMARRAEASSMAAAERKAIEDANNRPPLVQSPPENPHQVGRAKPEPVVGDGAEVPCHAAELRECADRYTDAEHRAGLVVADVERALVALWPSGDESEVIVSAVRESCATAGATLKKIPGLLRRLADLNASAVGAERERRHKAKRRGA